MNESKQMTVGEGIGQAKERFISIVQADPSINVQWEKESMFALQQVLKNDYTIAAAKKRPDTLRDAVVNIASIGLSLNPATAYAYLVPRDDAICLDISYRGLIKVATDTGSIMWAKADVVYAEDNFIYNGPAKAPQHTADPFSKERGLVVGVYCIAKTHDGDYLVEVMSEEEIDDIRSKSKSAKSAYSPWNTFPNEMRKKAVIKRASKTWPKTERHERLDNLIEHVNQEEGIDFDEPIKEEDIKHYDDLIHEKNGAALRNLMNDDWEYWSRVEATFYEKNKKVAFKKMLKEWMDEAADYVANVMVQMIELSETSRLAAMEIYEEMNEEENKLFWHNIQPEQRIIIENIINNVEQ